MENRIIINIGRQFGSGGRTIASMIGEKLGIDVYDSELVLKAAEQSGVRPEFFRHNDEKKRFFTFGYAQNAINDEGLFKIQSDTIRGIAESGSAVFVGRAADYVLRDMKCLDVFVCAPLEWRRQLVAERSKLSSEEAEKLIQKKDKARESWYTTSVSILPSSVSRALPISSSSLRAGKGCCRHCRIPGSIRQVRSAGLQGCRSQWICNPPPHRGR